MDISTRQIRYALRRLTQRPVFTVVALLSLALGIGANTAMFSLVDSLVLRDPPLANPEELVEIYVQDPEMPFLPFSYPDFEDLRRATSDVLAGVAGSGYAFAQLDRPDGVAVLAVELVSANYFSLLGVEPALGRGFLPEEEVGEGAHPVVVLSDANWRRDHGADPAILGREIVLSGRPFTVVGVAPPEYRGNLRGLAPDLYVPVTMDATFNASGTSRLDHRDSLWFFVKGRRQPGVTMAQLGTTLDGIAAHLHDSEREAWQGRASIGAIETRAVLINPLIDGVLASGAAVLLVVVGLVLVIACANLASFLLARAEERRKELAVRISLGATRRDLAAQMLAETLLLALLGGLLGLALAAGLVTLANNVELPMAIPITLGLSLDTPVLLFSLAISLLAGLFFGLAPALQSSKTDVTPALKDQGTGTGSRRLRLRSGLVIAQVALSTLLLVTAGLFLRSLLETQAIDPGFGTEPTAVLTFGVPLSRYSEAEARELVRRLGQEAEAIPGVAAVGLTDNLHLNILNTQSMGINVDGIEPPEGQTAHGIDYAVVDPGFFDAASIPLLAGRGFETSDRADGPRVAVVSQTFAERFFPGSEAIGRQLRSEGGDLEIVGIAADTKVRFIGEAPLPFVYLDYEQNFSPSMTLIARTSADDAATSVALLRLARRLDPELLILESKTMVRHLETMFFPARAMATGAGIFAVLALLLATIGLFGIVSYAVATRTREVGIRMALGARPGRVIGLLMGGGLSLVGIGLATGLLLAVGVSRLLGPLLFEIASLDPIVFAGVPALIGLVALLATFVPACRAGRVDPIRALRAE